MSINILVIVVGFTTSLVTIILTLVIIALIILIVWIVVVAVIVMTALRVARHDERRWYGLRTLKSVSR